MKQLKFQLLFIGFLFVILVACDNTSTFNKYKPISRSGWNKDSLVVFSVPVTDTLQNHNMYINVRNDVNYPYSNLWLFITIIQPGGKTMKDTFELSLAEPTGKWLGEGLGGVKTRQVIYRRDVYFPVSGTYKIELQQGMREDILKGIRDVGIRIEKAGS